MLWLRASVLLHYKKKICEIYCKKNGSNILGFADLKYIYSKTYISFTDIMLICQPIGIVISVLYIL